MISFLRSFLIPQYMVRYRSMSVIVSICIFVIFSFLIGIPLGQKTVKADLSGSYNFSVWKELENSPAVNETISEIVNKECRVADEKELVCENLTYLGNDQTEYQTSVSFVSEGITKTIHFVIELFDIRTIYIEDQPIDYYPEKEFILENYPYEENTEHYLLVLYSDSLYFQAHPHGINSRAIFHNRHRLKTETLKIYYQNMIPDFSFDLKNSLTEGYKIGEYLLEQMEIGKANTQKLQSYTLAFLMGTFFTLITVLLLWLFFRKTGKFKTFSEYYNIAAMNNVPIASLFFILLWFFPGIIYYYIFAFSIYYTISIYIINTREDFV